MPPEPTPAKSIEALSFEDALTQLQETVDQLESGALTLDQTIERFRLGTELANRCQRLIAEAELRITELTPAGDAEAPSADAEPPF